MEIDFVRVYQESTTYLAKNYQENLELTIYPNPVIDNLTIKLPKGKLNNLAEITIFNSKGQVVSKAQEFANNGSINLYGLQDLKRGIYFLRVNCDTEQYSLKFIK